jgi:predicted acylesterase/phospholipase RssA/CRP-like cAMP-binding protein
MVSNYQSRTKVKEVLRASPVFGQLDSEIIDDLANVLQLHTVPGGYAVVREGEAADEMLFVISGGLRVSRRNTRGDLMLYNEIRPGMSFGEAGLILRQPRAADVTAVRDSTLAILLRIDYEALLIKHPVALNQVFVRAIYNYLRHAEEVAERRHAQTFAVIPLHRGAPAREVASSLTDAFKKIGRTHHLASSGTEDATDDHGDPVDTPFGPLVSNQDDLEEHSDYLIYEAGDRITEWTLRAFRQADQIVFVTDADAPCVIGDLEKRLREQPDFSMKRMHLAVLHPAGTAIPSDSTGWLSGRNLERIYPLRSHQTSDFARLARFLTGTAVGVVLGGGGARGFAHVGVLRALKECGIPVDLVGGNSMGALIGAQYASGMALKDIVRQTQKFASGGEYPTIPLISLVSGWRVSRDLQRMFGDATVERQWIPFFAAACNLTKGCTTVQDSGPMWRAVLASNSPAGLFPPVLQNGDMLVDGAILENVPVEAMRMRLGTPLERRRGNGTIIAIDVDVHEAMGVDPELSHLSVWSAMKGHLFLKKRLQNPGIADILYRAGHIGGLNQRARTVAQADHYLEPPVSNFSMMSYKRALEIADVGYQYAMKSIATWKPAHLPRK